MATYQPECYENGPYGGLITTSRVFTARENSRCERCGRTVFPGECAQYVNNRFGHSIESIRYSDGICTLECSNGREVRYSEEYLRYGREAPYPPVKKEKKVSIESSIKAAEEALASLKEKKEKIDAWGKDSDYPNSSVILYQDASGYKRVVVKQSADVWVLGAQRRTWVDLVEGTLLDAVEVWFATEWERM